MRVFFVGSGLEGCFNVRCLLPLIANGFDGDRTTFLSYRRTPEDKARAAQDADIVVFHRPEDKNKLKLARILKKAGKKIIFDNDDTYLDVGNFKFTEYMDKERFNRGIKSLSESINDFIKEADLVTCTTEFLRQEYLKLNPNVVVLPNCIDPFYFPEPLKNETDIVRIGITGSVGITSDVEILKPIIKHYEKDKRVQLVLFSLPPAKDDRITRELYSEEYKFWESVNIEWQPFVAAEDYYNTLNELHLDMVIIPRVDNYFNRCKSNLKFLENSALQIPSICQSFPTGDGPYQVNPSDAQHLLLATDFESWKFQMEKLITNKTMRRKMGELAQKYVFENYDIEKHYKKWYNAYEKLLNERIS